MRRHDHHSARRNFLEQPWLSRKNVQRIRINDNGNPGRRKKTRHELGGSGGLAQAGPDRQQGLTLHQFRERLLIQAIA
jgi:hypothetical protein